ncbi:MAG: molecular chaperone HtpG, partial [Raoultibacter sp.]
SDLTAMRNNDREAYETFFENFGRALKYGIYSSYGMNKDLLGDLLLFHSAKQNKMITLDEYIESMAADQEAIFYAAGESVSYLAKTPIVKSVLDKGYDILLCTDDVDEFCLTAMQTYDEKELKNVAGGDLGLESDDEKTAAETAEKENEGLLVAMKETLGDQISKVSVSTRLADAPVCITAQGPVSLEMEKTLAGAPDGNEVKAERVLEVNAEHPIFKTLQKAQEAGDADKIKLYTDVLYNQALLIEGMPLKDPIAYAQAVCNLMQ